MDKNVVVGFMSYMIVGKGRYLHIEALRVDPKRKGTGLGLAFQKMANDFVKKELPKAVSKAIYGVKVRPF